VKKLKDISGTIANNYLRINAKMELLDPLLDDIQIHEKFDHCIGTHGLNIIRETMLLDIVKDLVGISFDKDYKSASLTNAFRILRCDKVRMLVQKEFVEPCELTWVETDISEELKIRFREEVQIQQRHEKLKLFEKLSSEIGERFSVTLTSPVALGLKDLRDKAIAHFEVTSKNGIYSIFKASELNLKWGDPRRFAEEIESFIFDLDLLVSGKSYALELFKDKHREIRDDFWRRIQGTG